MGQNRDHLPFSSTRFMLSPVTHQHTPQHRKSKASSDVRGRRHSQQIRNPKRIKQIPRPHFLLPMILPQVQKLENIRMPWLDVDSERTGTLVPALVDIAGGGVICAEHGDNTIGVAVCAGNVGAGGVVVKVSKGWDKERRRLTRWHECNEYSAQSLLRSSKSSHKSSTYHKFPQSNPPSSSPKSSCSTAGWAYRH